ncbi:Salicylate hydroxylase, partial [Phytophthora palmivora]
NWVVGTTKEDLAKDFAGFSKHVRDIISMMENTDIWALFHHLPAHTYTRGNMLVIGDAAHATTPNHGSGAAMAIEDAYVLSSLLAEVKHASDLKTAFQAFEKVRLYRTQKVVATSHEAGKLYDFELPRYEDDVKKIAQNLQKRMHWIWEENLEQEVTDAKTFFHTAAKMKY